MIPAESKATMDAACQHPNYLEELRKYILMEKANETILRGFEEANDIPEQMADDFRRMLASSLWALKV